MSSPPLILALDLGTTALKCALYDPTGMPVAEVSQEYSLLTPLRDWVEVAGETYWDALKTALGGLWGTSGVAADRVVAIGISAQGETLVPVGPDGGALRNAIVWLDNRARAEAEELADRFGRSQLYETTGQPEMLATWPAAKLLWMSRHEPHTTARTARYLLLEDFIIARLTGEYVTEGSLATSTCYWDFRAKAWWPQMLDAIGVRPEQLPTVVEPGTRVGEVRPQVAAELGLPSGVAVCTGALDQACAAIGAGNVDEGGFSENTGAAIALCANLATARLDENGRIPCHYHGIPETYMFHTFTSGGIVLRWFRDQFCEVESSAARAAGIDPYDWLGGLAAQTPPGADGLVMLPHLQGAMAPENNDAARGVFIGLTLRHGRSHVVRAVMESIAFIVRSNIEAMHGLGVRINTVRSVGGGSRSPLWKQIEADVLGRPVVTMRQPDASTLGAAILAGVGIGWWPRVPDAAQNMVTESRVYEPDASNRQLYEERYEAYLAAYAALEPVFPLLTMPTRA